MRSWQGLGLLSALLLVASEGRVAVSLPEAFQGKWAETLEACAKPSWLMVLQQGSLHVEDVSGEILSLRAISPRQMQVQVKLSVGGNSWEGTHALFLSRDGQSMLWLLNLEEPMDSEWSTLVRCK